MRNSATSLYVPGGERSTEKDDAFSRNGCSRAMCRHRLRTAQKSAHKTKTPETFAPGAFRMSLQLTGSSSPVSLGWGREFPRLLHPFSLLPAPDPRVAPRLGPLALISSGLQVAPNSRFADRLPVRPRVAPIAAPSDFAYGESPSCPGPSLRTRRLPADPRFPGYHAFRLNRLAILGSRPESRLPAAPSVRLRVSPAPALTAGSMMNPAKLELCILRRSQKMNLRVQSGVAYSPSFGCSPDLASSFHLPDEPAYETAQRNRAYIVLPGSKLPYPIPYKFINWKQSLGPFTL